MAHNDATSQAVGTKPRSKPDPNEALKSLSMPELLAELKSPREARQREPSRPRRASSATAYLMAALCHVPAFPAITIWP